MDAAAAPDLIAEAAQKNIKVLGLEGFLIDDAGTDPALSRIADFSADADVANRRAVALLSGDWATAPSAADQMHNQATGPHMLAAVLDG